MRVDVAPGAQPHLDPAALRIPPRDVLEIIGVEPARAEFGAQHLDEVAIERGGHACRVVVGSGEPRRRLDQVGADQEVVARCHCRPDAVEELAPFVLIEVADRSAEERDQALTGHTRQDAERFGEVGGHRLHGRTRVVRRDRARRVGHDLLADVEGNEQQRTAVPRQRVEQQAGLGRHPRTEFEQGSRAGELGDVTAAVREDLGLAGRRVVLGQPGDLVEQLAAALVVEPARRQPRRLPPQPGSRVGGDAAVETDAHRASRARRSPLNAQRECAGKKLR